MDLLLLVKMKTKKQAYDWWFRERVANFIACSSVVLGKTCHNTKRFIG